MIWERAVPKRSKTASVSAAEETDYLEKNNNETTQKALFPAFKRKPRLWQCELLETQSWCELS